MSQTTERIHELVDKRGRYRHEYYNEDALTSVWMRTSAKNGKSAFLSLISLRA